MDTYISIGGSSSVRTGSRIFLQPEHSEKNRPRRTEGSSSVVDVDSECCGQHQICEKESLLAAVSKKIEYYDDEELDRFKGRQANEYSDEEIDEFREIMFTMKEEEVAGWSRSLQLRGIELPDELKDELFLIVGERRFQHS